jgi:glycosyltransferase involved in cell wall biosynthesis
LSRNGRPDSVAIYLTTLFNGGVERVIFNLVGSFLAKDIEVDVVLDHLIYSPFKDRIPDGANLIELGANSIFGRVPKLASYLRNRQPDAMLSAMHFANEVAIAATRVSGVKTRVLVSEHTSLSTELACLPWSSPRRLIPKVMRATYGGADGVVAVSKGVAQDVERLAHLAAGQVHVIYNPLDFALIREEALAPVDHPWFQSGAAGVVLAIGRLEHQKNFSLLLEAFRRARPRHDVRLMILGEGSERALLEAKIIELGLHGLVQLPGFLPNPFAYLARAKALAMSSLWEGFPLVLIEAMSLNVPVAATDCPSGPHEALDGGKYGELVPMNDAEALAGALGRVLDGERKSAPGEWLRQFDKDHVAGKYLDLMAVNS